jgi:DNA-binding beta-propeller fold protein YncE
MSHFRERRPKLALVFASILILLFGISVAVGVRRQATQKNNKAAEEAVVQAQRLFDEGLALMELNPVMGRERLRQAKDILEPLTATLPERSRQGKPVHDLYAQVVDNVTRALRVVRFEPELFFDVSLVKKDARGHAFGIAQDSMGIIDQAGQTVYQLELATKNGQVMAGGDRFGGATAVAASAESFYVLADEGVHAVRRDDKKVLPQVIRPDSAWGEVNTIVSYGGNLYLLDKGKSRIWKYVSAESGFSELREYLNPDSLPDFSQATSMAIDGSVWVATADGRVLRFTQGKEHTYTIVGVEPPLGKTLAVYTSDTDEYVYVLDTESQRVVVLDKDGIYVSQYVWEGNFSPTGFAASEALKKLIFLADGKIYVTDLK